MTQILVIAKNTFRQTVRQRLFLNVVIFGIGMLLMGMVVATITFGYPDRVVRSIGLSGVSLALDLIALLIGVSLIHQEIDRKTLFVVLTRPVRRWQYTLGRYVGLLMTLATALLGLAVVYALTLLIVKGSPSLTDLIVLGIGLAEAALIAGIGLALSAFSTPTLSAGMGLGLWIAAATTDDLVRLTEKAGGALHALAKGIYYTLPALSRFNFRDAAIYRLEVPPADYLGALLYAVLYSVVLVAVASTILSRREMI